MVMLDTLTLSPLRTVVHTREFKRVKGLKVEDWAKRQSRCIAPIAAGNRGLTLGGLRGSIRSLGIEGRNAMPFGRAARSLS